MRLNDPAVVAAEYASEDELEGRRAACRYGSGPDPREVAFQALAEGAPRLVAITNGADHRQRLGKEFTRVERIDATGWIVFPDRRTAQAFVDSTISLRGEFPPFEGELRVRRSPYVFVADK